jgi:hypothetical protein
MHSRYIEATVHGLVVGCLYLPNGNPAPGPKFDYKLRWFERLTLHAKDLLKSGDPVVLAGDYNVMPTDLDVYAPERWVGDALFRPEIRDAYRRLVDQGWTDALRSLHPGERIYTFWDYWRNAYARNAGLRIDHLLLSPPLAKRLTAAGVDREVRGREKASDHAPTWIELADAATGAAQRRPQRRPISSRPTMPRGSSMKAMPRGSSMKVGILPMSQQSPFCGPREWASTETQLIDQDHPARLDILARRHGDRPPWSRQRRPLALGPAGWDEAERASEVENHIQGFTRRSAGVKISTHNRHREKTVS